MCEILANCAIKKFAFYSLVLEFLPRKDIFKRSITISTQPAFLLIDIRRKTGLDAVTPSAEYEKMSFLIHSAYPQ